jgi:hypothetical protein
MKGKWLRIQTPAESATVMLTTPRLHASDAGAAFPTAITIALQ